MYLKNYQINIKGVSPLSFNRPTDEKEPREDNREYEKRVWIQRLHIQDKKVFIPPMMIKNCLSDAAQFCGERVPGKGQATFTKHFQAGIMAPLEPIFLPYKQSDFVYDPKAENRKNCEPVFVPADGKKGGGSRVWKFFPVIPSGWVATFVLTVIDPAITKEALELHLDQAGSLIGLGRWRPRNNGLYGRFKIEKFVAI